MGSGRERERVGDGREGERESRRWERESESRGWDRESREGEREIVGGGRGSGRGREKGGWECV